MRCFIRGYLIRKEVVHKGGRISTEVGILIASFKQLRIDSKRSEKCIQEQLNRCDMYLLSVLPLTLTQVLS